ncbi:MAG: peptide deformylase [Bacteroidetes bacterium]|nr:MAG: peptide deformylase [Bacteroidota bacterium]
MIYPVTIYGNPVLRKVGKDIDENYENLKQVIDNMFETMYQSDGVGLAGPQVNLSLKIFVIDATPMGEDDETLKDFKKVFINAKITEESGDEWDFNEGCLSVPGIREDVKRKAKVRIEYYDEDFNFHDEYFDGIAARVIQHEYDHTQGILFTDRLSALKKRLLKGKLNAISKGKIKVNYRVVPNK